MKFIIYIALLLGAILLPASEGVRDTAIHLIKAIASGVERLFIRGDYAEIRRIDGDEFDLVINEPGRLVITVIHNEMATTSQGETQELDEAIRRMSGKVLVAKVSAEENQDLLVRLRIKQLPNVRIYSGGKLVKEFRGKVDNEAFLSAVRQHLAIPLERNGDGLSMKPMNEDWMPAGVSKRGSRLQK